jgi:hypothetical protein
MFIGSDNDCLLMDTLKKTYVQLGELDLSMCKIISPDWRMRKQIFPLKSTHFDQECEARLMETIITIPADCNRQIVSLNEVVWLLFSNNVWILVSPLK